MRDQTFTLSGKVEGRQKRSKWKRNKSIWMKTHIPSFLILFCKLTIILSVLVYLSSIHTCSKTFHRVVYCLVTKSCLTLLQPHGLQPTRLLCPWDSRGKNTGVGCHFLGVGCHFLLQGIFPTQGSNPHLLRLLHWQAESLPVRHLGSPLLIIDDIDIHWIRVLCQICAVLSHFSCVRLSATPWTMASQAPLSMGFSRQEHWSGLPFPSPVIKV